MSFMWRWSFARFFVVTIVGAIAVFPTHACAAEQPPGTVVVVARSVPTALLIWDASTAVGDLVIARETGENGMRELEADAVGILAVYAPALRARRLEIRVQYLAAGIVSAAYQATTFADATPLVILDADRATLLAHAAAWRREVANGHPPSGLSLRLVNPFPSPQ